jgi:hypothetical protein
VVKIVLALVIKMLGRQRGKRPGGKSPGGESPGGESPGVKSPGGQSGDTKVVEGQGPKNPKLPGDTSSPKTNTNPNPKSKNTTNPGKVVPGTATNTKPDFKLNSSAVVSSKMNVVSGKSTPAVASKPVAEEVKLAITTLKTVEEVAGPPLKNTSTRAERRKERRATKRAAKLTPVDSVDGKSTPVAPVEPVKDGQSQNTTPKVVPETDGQSPKVVAVEPVTDGQSPKVGSETDGKSQNSTSVEPVKDGKSQNSTPVTDGQSPKVGSETDGQSPKVGSETDGQSPKVGSESDGQSPKVGSETDGQSPKVGSVESVDVATEERKVEPGGMKIANFALAQSKPINSSGKKRLQALIENTEYKLKKSEKKPRLAGIKWFLQDILGFDQSSILGKFTHSNFGKSKKVNPEELKNNLVNLRGQLEEKNKNIAEQIDKAQTAVAAKKAHMFSNAEGSLKSKTGVNQPLTPDIKNLQETIKDLELKSEGVNKIITTIDDGTLTKEILVKQESNEEKRTQRANAQKTPANILQRANTNNAGLGKLFNNAEKVKETAANLSPIAPAPAPAPASGGYFNIRKIKSRKLKYRKSQNYKKLTRKLSNKPQTRKCKYIYTSRI